MRALLCHCKNYETEITGISERPAGIRSEVVAQPSLKVDDAIVALITVESGDVSAIIAPRLAKEIKIMCHDTGHQKVVLLPFAHLSSSLADSETTLGLLDSLVELLADIAPIRGHYGSDKHLKLDIYGHPGNVRYREFYSQEHAGN